MTLATGSRLPNSHAIAPTASTPPASTIATLLALDGEPAAAPVIASGQVANTRPLSGMPLLATTYLLGDSTGCERHVHHEPVALLPFSQNAPV
jgi:hypothetical protein